MPLLINGQRIDDGIVETEFAGIKAYNESLGNVSCCERDPEFRATARDNIVARVLLAQEAGRALPPSPEADVEAALAKLIDEYGGKDWFFMRTGATEEQLPLVRRDIDVDLRVKRMLEALAGGAQPTDAELRAHYEQNVKALRAGADFEALARQHSEKAEDSIDLGFFKKGELAPEFEAVAFSLDVGEVSPVFASQYGLHLITVTERRPATPKPFDDVKEEVRQHWRAQKRDRATRDLVEQLKGTAKVEEIDPEVEAAQAMA
jgi:hypothetical protein